jgi:probable DNA repair protein
MHDKALALLAGGVTLVTPTRRLAQAIRRAYDLAQQRAGHSAWASADALSWSAWLQREWQAAQFATALPQLLDAQQELALWERIVDASPVSERLLDPRTVAGQARDAWHIACAYRLEAALERHPGTEDTQAFLAWRDAFTRYCDQHALIDAARLPDALAAQVASGRLPMSQRLALAGFDGFDPQRLSLFDTLRRRGTQVEQLDLAGEPGQAAVVAHAGPEQEVRFAASWARAQLERLPDARIGVVVPDLSARRAAIARIFDEVLLPGAALAPGAPHPRPWNLSLGLPLADWPVVHAALLALELPEGRLPAARMGVLLRSPFLGEADSECMPRALLDRRLCALGEPHVDLDALEFEAARSTRTCACPLLLQRVRDLRRRVREKGQRRQPPSAWGPHVQSLLAALGWPGQRSLDSEEHQAVEAWRDLVAGLARFDLILGQVSYAQVLHLMRRLAGEQLFQPETPDVPVQILGVLEAAGLQFDQLLVLGLHGDAWPRPARPNPLLPVELQRRGEVPGNGAAWELAFARRTMQAWQRAAPHVVFSHPSMEEDRELRASPLLAGLPAAQPAAVPEAHTARIFAGRAMELLEDSRVAALPEGIALRSGVSVFRDQAACPFRAFAAHRLGADSIEHPQDGLDALERGTLVHAALACFWERMRDHAALAALGEPGREACVRDAVDQAVADFGPRRRSLLLTRFIDLERARLTRLLLEWLEVDRGRPAFEVQPPEQEQHVVLAGLRLRMRPDRVDRMGDGREVLIDYKTGKPGIAHWFGERPDEPQLLAYAVARTPAPAALAFAIVRPGECALRGLGEDGGLGRDIMALEKAKQADRAPDWPAQMRAWSATIDALGRRFRGTEVHVDPKRGAQTCRTCSFGVLCRVGDVPGMATDAAGEEG